MSNEDRPMDTPGYKIGRSLAGKKVYWLRNSDNVPVKERFHLVGEIYPWIGHCNLPAFFPVGDSGIDGREKVPAAIGMIGVHWSDMDDNVYQIQKDGTARVIGAKSQSLTRADRD